MTFKQQGLVLPFSQAKGVLVAQSIMAYLEQESPSCFPYNLLNVRNKEKNYYQRATYEDKISMFPQQSAAFLLQETSCLNAIITTKSTYNESHKICPRRT